MTHVPSKFEMTCTLRKSAMRSAVITVNHINCACEDHWVVTFTQEYDSFGRSVRQVRCAVVQWQDGKFRVTNNVIVK